MEWFRSIGDIPWITYTEAAAGGKHYESLIWSNVCLAQPKLSVGK